MVPGTRTLRARAPCSVDPVNDTFWAANEYSRSSLELWGTWVANFALTSTGSPLHAAGLPTPQGHDAASMTTGAGNGALNGSGRNADAGLIELLPEGGGADGERGTVGASLPPSEPDVFFSIPRADLFELHPAEWFLFSGLDT
jgi:hypothetical protein